MISSGSKTTSCAYASRRNPRSHTKRARRGRGGPSSTSQIDCTLRLSSSHDSEPGPTRYPEDTGLRGPAPPPPNPSVGGRPVHRNEHTVKKALALLGRASQVT